MFPEDVLYQTLLGQGYFSVGRQSDAQDAFKVALDRDYPNGIAIHLLQHRVYCVGCDHQIKGQRWKCLDNSCSKYDWCDNCVKVRGSVGSLCSHDRLMSIPSSRVKELRKNFEPGNLGNGGPATRPGHSR